MNAERDDALLNAPRATVAPTWVLWALPLFLAPLLLYGNPLAAILAGAGLAIAVNRPIVREAASYGKMALQSAIVLLGFNLDAQTMWQLSQEHAGLIAVYVVATLGVGIAIGRFLGVDRILVKLMAAGTAICGGTAIATLGPIVRARADQIAMALTIVFVLNMVALATFPWVGERLQMTQAQFGIWAALAVHDTSSVVAVATLYGDQAAEVATTLKLGRTLWLIPLALAFGLLGQSKGMKIRVPSFIIFFVLASMAGSLLRAYLPIPQPILDGVQYTSKSLIVLALFFIGLECTRTTLRDLGGRVLLLALALWSIVVPLTLVVALNYG